MQTIGKKTAFIIFVCGLLASISIGSSARGVTQAEPALTPVEDITSWRLTRFGWQDSTTWLWDSFAPQPAFELIHPVIWAALVLLTVLAAMIWASNEWEYAQLFEPARVTDEEITRSKRQFKQ